MQRLEMTPRWEWGLISVIKSYLAFSFFNFSKTTLLQLGVYSIYYIMVTWTYEDLFSFVPSALKKKQHLKNQVVRVKDCFIK